MRILLDHIIHRHPVKTNRQNRILGNIHDFLSETVDDPAIFYPFYIVLWDSERISIFVVRDIGCGLQAIIYILNNERASISIKRVMYFMYQNLNLASSKKMNS